MADADLERLSKLESLARSLEPDAAARSALASAAFAYAERLLEVPAQAYRPDEGSAAALASLAIGPDPAGLRSALDFLARHVELRGHTCSAPGFFAYIPGGNLYHAALADFLAAVLNPFTGRLVASPAGVRIENQVLEWLGSLIGFPATAAGNLTSGGSLANLSAIVSARQAAGIRARDVERSVVYLTDHAHHCLTKGLRVAGLGECLLRRVPMDDRYRMRTDGLDDAIASDARTGLKPWLVVASAGTTDTGAVDPLDEIARVASHHDVWFHVDGAYGGMFTLCPRGKKILRGIEHADSVVLDPHKGMLLPFGIGAVLVKNRQAVQDAHTFEAHYITDEVRNLEEVSPTEHSAELSRPFRGLRIWLPLQILGTQPFAAAVEEKLLLTQYAYEKIRQLDRIEVGPEPDLSTFIFRALPLLGDADAHNRAIERRLLEDGRILLSSTVVDGKRYLRFAVLALQTHRDAIDLAVELIAEAIREVE